jgi:hypothetical protein
MTVCSESYLNNFIKNLKPVIIQAGANYFDTGKEKGEMGKEPSFA